MNQKQAASIAVAYLVKHKEEAPKEAHKLLEKLVNYENAAKKTQMALRQAEEAINQLQVQDANIFGSISTVVELIAEDLPKDKVLEWCEKYEIPAGMQMPSKATSAPKQQVPDMAGHTAQSIEPNLQTSE